MANLNAPVGYFGNPLLETSHLIDYSYLDSSNSNKNASMSSLLALGRNPVFSSSTSLLAPSSEQNYNHVNSYQSCQLACSSEASVPTATPFPLLKLPAEVIVKITLELDQNDSLNLMVTCSYLYAIVKPRIWSHIVVDSNYSEFNREMITAARLPNYAPTFVKTSFRIRSLSNILKRADTSDTTDFLTEHIQEEDYISLIKKVSFTHIPQDFLAYEVKNIITSGTFQNLPNLTDVLINLKLTSLPIESLISKFNLNKITSLSISLDLSPHDIAKFTLPDLPEDQYANLFPLPNLQELALSLNFDNNHHNSVVLYYMFKSLICAGNDVSSTLRSLKVHNNSNFSNSDAVLSNTLINDEPRITSDHNTWVDVHVLTNLFKPLVEHNIKLQNLVELSLNGFIVVPHQAYLLLKCVDLNRVETFKLEKISEIQLIGMSTSSPQHQQSEFFNNNRALIISQLKPGFLTILSNAISPSSSPHKNNKLTSLRTLVLDYKEPLKDSIVPFLQTLPAPEQLRRLNLTIRWNMKSCRVAPQLQPYAASIIHHLSSRFARLEQLAMDIKREIKPMSNSPGGDQNELVNSDIFLHYWAFFARMRALRVFCHSLDNSFVKLLMGGNKKKPQTGSYPSLQMEFLDLFGPGAGGRPNMALNVAHAGIFDDWFKVQHVAIQLAQRYGTLRFIRINGRLFEIKRGRGTSNCEEASDKDVDVSGSVEEKGGHQNDSIEVMPREGTNEWFDGIVKSESWVL